MSGARRPYPEWLERGAGVSGRLLVVFAAAAVVVWLALQVQFITTAIVLGFAITSLLWPVARRLRTLHLPAVVAAVVCVAGFVALFGALLWFVALRVADSIPTLVGALTNGSQDVVGWLRSTPLVEQSESVDQVLNQAQRQLGGLLGDVGMALFAGLSAVANLLTVLGVALFFAIFALTGGDSLWRSFVAVLSRPQQAPADAAFRAAMRSTGAWLYASTATGLIDGALIGTGLYFLGVPLAIPIGALTFVFAYVPLIGATIAGALAVLVALASGGLVTALWALGVVLLVQQVEGNILAPLLLSRAVNFPPLVVLVLTTSAAAGFGLIGLFLAVPVSGALVAATLAYRRANQPDPPPAALAGGDGAEASGPAQRPRARREEA